MSKPRKQRSPAPEDKATRRDAKLLDLPEKDRAIIAGWLKSDGASCCLQRIAQVYQITCAQSTLYNTLAYWRSKERRQRTRALALSQLEQERADTKLSPQQFMALLDRRMAEIYAADEQHEQYQDARYLIIADESARAMAEMAKLKLKLKQRQVGQKDRDHALAVEKLVIASCEKIMKAARDPKMREIVESTIPQAEKIAAIRKAYFADVDATKVELPE